MRNYFKYISYLIAAVTISCAHANPQEDLWVAVNRDDAGAVSRLVRSGSDPNALDNRGRTMLGYALLNESHKAAEALLAAPQLDINKLNPNGESALMIAALRGRLDWVQRLVAKGAKINHDGWSALHYAATGPNPEVVDWLIGKGAFIDGRSPNGTTPLMMAARYGAEANVDRLLAAKAEIRASNEHGLTAVDFAKAGGRESLAARLEKLMPR
ncbi:ankyrin repeat domain-containing protein [Piscinibacter sakaiensis]|uniref:ankyrin repeat domain-containing protein n=1 Tax=Piscinibacter sakaiensis TaxID=1547922 RepID=UPI003AAD52F8